MNQARAHSTNQAIRYIEQLHGDSKGWITLCRLGKNFSHYHYKFVDLMSINLATVNMFISMSTFFKPQRRLENIKELRAVFMDIDCYKKGLTKDQVLFFLTEDFFGTKIPYPTYIIDSGQGLYLEWLIEPVPSQALPLWKSIEDYLYKQLKDFGADRQAMDATRILRIPDSINPKVDKQVKLLYSENHRYTLREIQAEYLPDLDETYKNKKGRPKKIIAIYRERSLYQARINDLIKLCELRDYDMQDYRELTLFLYRYYTCYFTDDVEKALEDTLELNTEFKKPLPQIEAKRATRSAERAFKDEKLYKYKNETLIELFGISEEEQNYMQTIIGKPEYRRRDRKYQKQKYHESLKAQGKLTEKEKVALRREKIKDLLDKGLKQKDILDTLNISKPTYIRDRKYLKEQGYI